MHVIPYPLETLTCPILRGDPALQPVQVMTLSNQDVLRLITWAGTLGRWRRRSTTFTFDKDFIACGEYSEQPQNCELEA